jgi:mannose-6-phosphate isomerase-like protein (cupin superfamily)
MNNLVIKPWGSYENILERTYCQVKEIIMKPGQQCSYQYHFKRSEIWIVVQGVAQSRIDDVYNTHKVGDTIVVTLNSKHQIKNIGTEDLIYVEVELGDYFGEDDIVRVEDPYGRI